MGFSDYKMEEDQDAAKLKNDMEWKGYASINELERLEKRIQKMEKDKRFKSTEKLAISSLKIVCGVLLVLYVTLKTIG